MFTTKIEIFIALNTRKKKEKKEELHNTSTTTTVNELHCKTGRIINKYKVFKQL